MCNLLSKAQEVLLDPHKRAVYDANGVEGLEYMEARRVANKDITVEKVSDLPSGFSFVGARKNEAKRD